MAWPDLLVVVSLVAMDGGDLGENGPMVGAQVFLGGKRLLGVW